MSPNHSEGKDDEETLKPEDDVVEEVHLALEAPHQLEAAQQHRDGHHTAQHKPRLLPEEEKIKIFFVLLKRTKVKWSYSG